MSNEMITENVKVTSTAEEMSFNSWEDDDIVALKQKLLRGIYAYGFETPSPIQKRAIIPLVLKHDVIAQAQSGTGKTGAFIVGALQLLDEKKKEPQVLILAHTRELARQIYSVVEALSNQMSVTYQLLVGGTSTDDDREKLEDSPPQIIIGCPGRVHDMIRRKYLKTRNINLMILDEADELLSHGFKDQIYKIFQFMHQNIQIGLFSATMPQELNILTSTFLRNPIKILIKKELLTLQGIAQYFVALDNDEGKYQTLKDLFGTLSVSQAIIYCNSIRRVDDLYDAMKHDEFPVQRLHGGLDESDRKQIYSTFKNGACRVLIATDLIARGIDVQQVSIVINFDIPKNVHTYLHRIGRSGRWGRKGVGINFITRRDVQKLKEIEEFYSTEVKEFPENYKEVIR
jgi:translation initiation factor 4A